MMAAAHQSRAASLAARPLVLVILLVLLSLATKPIAAATYAVTPTPPARLQYEDNNGYCGEVTLQTLMIPFGVWLPQRWTRQVGGGELLPGLNYAATMDALRIRYNTFTGSGGYRSFAAWAKKQLMQSRAGVVAVTFLRGERDRDYDHNVPIVSIDTSSSPTTYVYNARDVFTVYNDFSTSPIKRTASSFSCARTNKKDGLAKAGCVPSDTSWGHAILGPTYAGIGPRVSLSVPSPASEPAIGTATTTFQGTVTAFGLQPGGKYKLYRVTRLERVPASASDAAGLAQVGDLVASFTAIGETWTSAPVSFASDAPVWFIAVVAA